MEEQYDKAYIRALASKWKKGTLSSGERDYLERWDKSHQDDILLLDENSQPNEILNRMLSRLQLETHFESTGKKGVRRLWSRIAVAAAAVSIILGAGLFYYKHEKTQSQFVKNEIMPGKSGATLTLANGKQIRLAEAANGELATEAGVSITKTNDGELIYQIRKNSEELSTSNTLSTARGETYQLLLPDGSRVWLNSASSLKYPSSFSSLSQREVQLTGEAYFEIQKDESHPFIVESSGQRVEVLGTHFNINSYADEPEIKTTLLEGRVKVTTRTHKETTLKPGEQAKVAENGQLSLHFIDTEQAIAWKNNQFVFEEDDIEFIMRMIERWYDVQVIYQGAKPVKKFWGGVSRFDNISSVLKILEMTGGVHFKIEGRKVYVTR